MARIALAWELGAGFGHLARLLPLAVALRRRGHDCVFIVRDPHRAQGPVTSLGFPILQAPVWRGATPRFDAPLSYAGVIRRCGFHAAPGLAGLVSCWRGLFDLLAPDLILMEHAPAAMVAAQIDGRRVALIGSGWSLPPLAAPLPAFEALPAEGATRQLVAEAQVLTTINLVRRELGRPPLDTLAALFAAADSFLCTFPELDHYAPRPAGAEYIGPLELPIAAAAPDWPDAPGEARRVFAFLDADRPDFAELMAGLAETELPVLAVARDLHKTQRTALETERLRFAEGPVDLERAVAECAAVVCQGGHGTLAAALVAGRPVLLLPLRNHTEQRVTAERLTAAGVALAAAPGAAAPAVASSLRRLVENPGYTAAVAAVARRHAEHDPRAAAEHVAERCERLLRAPVRAVP